MSKRVLVVDDDRRMLELERVLFTKHGFEVVVASDGSEAIEAALKSEPDLIVLDIEMPGKDGYATLMELRSHKKLKDVPVIVLSALTDDVYHKISESMGTVEHIDKPFDPERLISKAKEILDIR
jgi:DNA-binding response OmpR family regulator